MMQMAEKRPSIRWPGMIEKKRLPKAAAVVEAPNTIERVSGASSRPESRPVEALNAVVPIEDVDSVVDREAGEASRRSRR